jgi:hypothetical protein
VSVSNELPDVMLCRLVNSYRAIRYVDWLGVTGSYAVSVCKELPNVLLCQVVRSYRMLCCVDW